jgi:hypothetical protein
MPYARGFGYIISTIQHVPKKGTRLICGDELAYSGGGEMNRASCGDARFLEIGLLACFAPM